MAKKRKLASNSENVPAKTEEQQVQMEEDPQQEQPQQEEPQEEEPQEEEPQEEENASLEENKGDEVGEEVEYEEEEEQDHNEIGVPEKSSENSNPNGENIEDEDENDPNFIQKLLEPFSKDQLIDLLGSAANEHPDVFEKVRSVADIDPAHRKIFVHGLGWDTSAETLTEAFKQYGEIEDCNAVRDKASGRSKGYGFILFKHRSGARRALKEPQKKIGNRMTACQLASAGPVPAPQPAGPPATEYTQRKIYVSNVSADIDPQKLLQFFSKFGEIEEGPLGLDKQTGKPKGFTLFVYKSIESAKRALEEPHKTFEGHTLHCQKAVDGPKPNKPNFGQNNPQFQGRGGGHGAHFQRNDNPNPNANFMGTNLMAGTPGGLNFNQGAATAAPAINPALGQALAAVLTQGAGLGLTNLLGGLGTGAVPGQINQVNPSGMGMQGGYGNPPIGGSLGGYGSQQGYPNQQMGQGGGRSQQGGHMGGSHYMGH